MAVWYKWKIEEVILLPFGALTIFNEDLNRKMKEEFLIVIMGPIFQIIFTFFIYKIFKMSNILEYSKFILFFNLLPIYPLDGSKILSLFLNVITSFFKSHMIVIFVSFLTIIFLIFISDFNLILILILVFLCVRVFEEYLNHNNLFNRFLLERYLKKYRFIRYKRIKNIRQMKRDYSHFILSNGKYVCERQALNKRFDFKGKL